MKELKIIYTKGLPASGKSTWAKEYCKKHSNFKRVNKDDLRKMIDDGTHSKGKEKFILSVRDDFIKLSLYEGHSVIVDDTNFADFHIKRFQEIADELSKDLNCKIRVEEKSFLDVSVEECIARDQKRQNYVGEKVIRTMWNQYLHPDLPKNNWKALPHNFTLGKCIIIDVDGTLAYRIDRSPFEYDKVLNDEPRKEVIDLIHSYLVGIPDLHRATIFVFSGRDDSCHADTLTWLKTHLSFMIEDSKLVMRKTGDFRCDTIVKKEMWEEHIKDKYNVLAVFDDRRKVVSMWRDIGLFCVAVDEGNF